MAIGNKSIVDWKTIMLDSSVIIALFMSQAEEVKDEDIRFTKDLIDFLNSHNSGDGKPRKFLIPTIVLSEVITIEDDQEKIKRILRVLNSNNVEFVDFDFATSMLFNHHLKPYIIKRKNLNKLALEIGFKSGDYGMAREWIHRDFMIAMSGKAHEVDVILTADCKTFYPLSNKIDAFCALTYKRFFNKPFSSIIEYYHLKAVEEYYPKNLKDFRIGEQPKVQDHPRTEKVKS